LPRLRRPRFTAFLFLSLILFATRGLAELQNDNQQGVIDLQSETARQIEQIKARLSLDLDMPAERQTVLLLWLIELCDSTSRFRDVKSSYEKILSFYPCDVGVLNRYARFTLEREKNIQGADSLLQSARTCGKLIKANNFDRGTTRHLIARVHIYRGEYDQAISDLDSAFSLFSEAPKQQLRVLKDLVTTLHTASRYDEAIDTLLRLIGIQRGFNAQDMNDLKQLMELTEKYRSSDALQLARKAVEDGRILREKEIEKQGGKLVQFASLDGFPLEGTFYRGEKEGAAIFIPAPGDYRGLYSVSNQLLYADGISSLSIDLRNDESTAASASDQVLEKTIGRLPDDVAAGVLFLQNKLSLKKEQIAIIAESSACAIVETAIYDHKLASPVLYISPIFDEASMDLSNAIAFRPEKPVFVIYSMEDRVAYSSTDFFKRTKPTADLETLELMNAGHGMTILKSSPNALATIETWVERVLNLTSDGASSLH
jgi:tetratricopeptide (TPR) repeat protein